MPEPKSPSPPTAKPCPICGKPANMAILPFCSKRCADIDLHHWLGGAYAILGDTSPGKDKDS
ncbi:MAG TPA: DNA gyrase inhibitor YacG [Methylocella sp.]|nr:DNA gyrase inhibitor YacG [Methylocella sp.]